MVEPGLGQLGKILIFIGVGVALVGGLIVLGDKLGLGRLPGDLTWRGKNTVVHFPIVTSLVVSLVLTVLLNLFFSRR